MMATIQYTNNTQLGELLNGLVEPLSQDVASLSVSGVQIDSRKIATGELFLACIGHEHDGRNYIADAIAAGACAVVCEMPVEKKVAFIDIAEPKNIPIIEMENLSLQCSEIAGRFYRHPSKKLPVMAVTGTNGKTSCSQLMMQYVELLGKRCAVVGTLGVGVDGVLDSTANTTPDAVSLQSNLAKWLDDGVDTVAMEVSSHGLVQGRVSALDIELALFTNLSRDHLDYHGSMQAYANAKAMLFQQQGLKVVVLNSDDVFSNELEKVAAEGVKVVRYSTKKSVTFNSNVDVWVESLEYHDAGVNGLLHTPWGSSSFSSPLLGEFNLSNLLAVIASLGSLGFPIEKLASATARLKTISGRMERVAPLDQGDISVVVDYAHTPDALEQALKAAHIHVNGKLWCVFGCGGDRDQGKRPKMGAVVERYSDYVVVTSDNPRHESANHIIDEILSGVQRPSLVEVDRAAAIEFAITHAEPGDCVLIAGKGHEQYQQLGDEKIPFDDFKQARIALIKRRDGGER